MAYQATVADPAPNRSLVSWGSVFAGALIAFAVMTLLTLPITVLTLGLFYLVKNGPADLKLYLQAYRNRGIYYEHVTNVILDDLVAAMKPRRMTVEGDFRVRGGISTVVRAEYEVPAPGRARVARGRGSRRPRR